MRGIIEARRRLGHGVIVLAAVAALAQAKPSEPFLTLYLLRAKSIAASDLERFVWPCATWGAFALALPVGLLADAAGSRVVILCGMLCRQATRTLLLFAQSVPAMAGMQLTYAASAAADTALFACSMIQHKHSMNRSCRV